MSDKSTGIGMLILIFLVALIILNPLVIVKGGERAVVEQFGAVQSYVWDEGPHIKVPFMHKIIKINVQTQKVEAMASAASNDMQVTTTSVAINYHLDPNSVNEIYQTVGKAYVSKIIEPAIQETVKASTANWEAGELITQRPLVKAEMTADLKERLAEKGIILETVYITNFDFSDQFNAAIEAKVTAQQKADEAANDLVRIGIEAEQERVRAQGEADGIAIIQEQLKVSPSYIEYLSVTKWNGELPQVTGGAIPLISVGVE